MPDLRLRPQDGAVPTKSPLFPRASLGLRLMLLLAGIFVPLAALMAYLVARGQKEQLLGEAVQSTHRLADTVRRSTRFAMLNARRDDVREIIEAIGQQEGVERVRILNKEGVIIYSSAPSEVGNLVDKRAEGCTQCHASDRPPAALAASLRSRIFAVPSGHRVLGVIDIFPNDEGCSTAACHAHPEAQRVLGVLDIALSLEDMDRRVAATTRQALFFAAGALIVVCGLAGLFIHRFVHQPVRELLAGTRRVAAGDLDHTIPVTSADEVGHLADAFNRMTGNLKGAQAELRETLGLLEKKVEEKTRELKLAQERALRTEKLSSLGMMAAGVAHELNSPLTGVLTFAHLLLRKTPEGSAERKDLQLIVDETNRCSKIIRQLLDFARETPPEKVPRDLNGIVDSAVALVEHQALFHNIRIERGFDPALPQVSVDAGQLKQVFVNLLLNAAEAMAGGGTLSIRTRTAPEHVEIDFADTGCGIPPEIVGKIFDPFFSTKKKGTGLGLAVSYGILERHGGTIEVESQVGRGTTFTVSLPRGAPGG